MVHGPASARKLQALVSPSPSFPFSCILASDVPDVPIPPELFVHWVLLLVVFLFGLGLVVLVVAAAAAGSSRSGGSSNGS